MYLPPVLRPLPVAGAVSPTFRVLADARYSVTRGVPGSYVAERLAGLIEERGRLQDCVWLRAGDRGPADLSHALTGACRLRWSGEGLAEVTPNPQQLGEQIRAAPEGAVIVLELNGRVTREVNRLVKGIRPILAGRGVSVIAVAESRIRPLPGRTPDRVAAASELVGHDADEAWLSSWNRSRLLGYVGRRTAVTHDVLTAARLWSPEIVVDALDAAHGLSSFLDRLTDLLLTELAPDRRTALGIALTTGYWHPQWGTSPIPAAQLRPWLVPLEQRWGWLRPIWRSPLRRALSRCHDLPPAPPVASPTRPLSSTGPLDPRPGDQPSRGPHADARPPAGTRAPDGHRRPERASTAIRRPDPPPRRVTGLTVLGGACWALSRSGWTGHRSVRGPGDAG